MKTILKLLTACKVKNNMKRCNKCGNEFEYDEGMAYDNETFICFECAKDGLSTQTINWSIKNE